MKRKKDYLPFAIVVALALPLMFMFGSCQYDYSSPLPGTVQIHLKTVSNKIAFTYQNNFVLKVTAVEAIRDDGARAPIYADTKAIGRTTSIYNTLDTLARDSALIIGEGYAPPASYRGVDLLIEPGSFVVLDGYRFIRVVVPERFDKLLKFRSPYTVEESGLTVINVTVDLDSSLVPTVRDGEDVYLFKPLYYISNIR